MNIKIESLIKLPNVLSLLRVILVVSAVYLVIVNSSRIQIVLILTLLLLFATDFLSGVLSRKLNQITELGKILDPLVDKISSLCILLSLVFYQNFPITLVVLLFYRDLIIVLFGGFIISKLKIIPESNFLGKLSTTSVSVTVLLFILNIGSGIFTVAYFISILLVIISGINYFLKGEKIIFKPTQRLLFRIVISIISVSIISILFNLNFNRTKIISQNISCNFIDEKELLFKYSPILYFASNEKFSPIAVESFLNNSCLMKSSYFLPFDKKITSDASLIGDIIGSSNQDYYLKIDRSLFSDIESYYDSVKNNYKKTIYARASKWVVEEDTVYILQYWLFYWASILPSINLTWHECDWEMLMFLLDNNYSPLKAGYSQHHYGEVKNWDFVNMEENHPVAFVSLGAHSVYFEAGDHPTFLGNTKKLRLGADKCEKRIRLAPGDYELKVISEKLPWIKFGGSWGIPITTKLSGPMYRNPMNPDLTMWKSPLEWFNRFSK